MSLWGATDDVPFIVAAYNEAAIYGKGIAMTRFNVFFFFFFCGLGEALL